MQRIETYLIGTRHAAVAGVRQPRLHGRLLGAGRLGRLQRHVRRGRGDSQPGLHAGQCDCRFERLRGAAAAAHQPRVQQRALRRLCLAGANGACHTSGNMDTCICLTKLIVDTCISLADLIVDRTCTTAQVGQSMTAAGQVGR